MTDTPRLWDRRADETPEACADSLRSPGALILSPSPPRIAPTQFRLVER